jgi:hypothetical protein
MKAEQIRETVEALRKALEADPDSIAHKQSLRHWERRLEEATGREAQPKRINVPRPQIVKRRRTRQRAGKGGGTMAVEVENTSTAQKGDHHGRGEG